MTLTTLKLVYKNMTWNRPKFGLLGLLFMAGFTSANVFFSSLKFGAFTAWMMGGISLVAWVVILPMIFTFIDCYKSPERINTLLKVMNEKQ